MWLTDTRSQIRFLYGNRKQKDEIRKDVVIVNKGREYLTLSVVVVIGREETESSHTFGIKVVAMVFTLEVKNEGKMKLKNDVYSIRRYS